MIFYTQFCQRAKVCICCLQGPSAFFRLWPEKQSGTMVLAEKELKVVFAGMCLLTLINGQFCDHAFIHTEGSKKQINNEAVLKMPKKR